MKTQTPPVDPLATIADEIERLSDSAKRILNGRLSKRAIMVLIQDAQPTLSLKDIALVLDSAANLKNLYLKKLESHGKTSNH